MELVRFYCMGRSGWGQLVDDGVRVMEGNPFDGTLAPGEHVHSRDDVTLLPPTVPTKIVCVGSNYRQHCEEMGRAIPEVPKLFLKPPSAVIGPSESICIPPGVGRVDFEGELAVVVGRKATRVPEASAMEYVSGYTVLNDVTAREIQRAEIQFTRAKGFDTFCPMGPALVSCDTPNELQLETRLNGEIRQQSSTSEMIFGVTHLVSFISHVMTLMPGDVIATGTPSGVGALKAGDDVAITIQGIGTLSNTVEDV